MDSKEINFPAKQVFHLCVLLLLWITALILLLHTGSLRSPMMMDISSLALLTLHARLLGRIPFSLFSCLVLFPLLLIEMTGLGLNCVGLPYAPLISFFFLLDLFVLIYWQQKSIRRYAIGISLTGVTGCLLLLGKELLQKKFTYTYYETASFYGWGSVRKTLVFFSAAFLYLILFIAVLKLIRRLLSTQNAAFRFLQGKLQGLELYILTFAVILLIFITILPYSSFLYYHRERLPSGMTWFRFFFFFIIGICTCLLAKTIFIKEKMQVIQDEKEAISTYKENLESNLDHMKEIRHDTKNLFLTMAGFVERSGDPEMKAFYRQNITPFLQDALVKNDLLNQLKCLKDDQLKSFLYYKLAGQVEAGIPVQLTVSSPVCLDVGYGDLIRLLGILLDNAAEEAALAHGPVRIAITEDPSGIGVRIENAIRPEVRARGITPGVTDKGSGHGNGLLFARKIIRKYSNLRLNSYFTESGFVQYLLIAKTRR